MSPIKFNLIGKTRHGNCNYFFDNCLSVPGNTARFFHGFAHRVISTIELHKLHFKALYRVTAFVDVKCLLWL